MAGVRKRAWRTKAGEAKVAWTVDIVDRQGVRERRQFATKREADAFRISIEAQVRGGTFRAEGAKVSVAEVAALFLTYCEGRMRRGERMTRHNLKVYRGHIENYLCPVAGSQAKKRSRARPFSDGVALFKIRQLTARHVGEFRDRLREAGVSVSTTRKILGTLQLVLEHAVSLDLAAINVARGVKVIGRRDEGARKIVPPSKDDLRRLLTVADPDFRVLLIFASATGLRAGELHALRWRHIDFKRNEVTIESRVDAYGQEDVTKTAAGMRQLPLADSIAAMMREWRGRSRHAAADDLVFPNRHGGYERHDNMVKRRFLPLFRQLTEWHTATPGAHPPAPVRFNWHALRHFAVSCWIEAGLNPKTIQVYAGHSSLQVTMDRYGHLFKSDDHRLKLDAISRDTFTTNLLE